MKNQIIHGNILEIAPTLLAQSVNCIVTSPPYWGLRDYGHADQIGLEATPEEYVQKLTALFRELRRVLRDDGTLWLNLGDSYGTGTTAPRQQGKRGLGANTQAAQDAVPRAGGMAKQLTGIPWRVALALQADGWILRSDIIWAKPNPMPESVTDRPTKAHEYIFLLSKAERYYYDAEAVAEPAQQWSGRAATFARNGAVSAHVLPGQSAAVHRANRTDSINGDTRNRRTVWTVATKPYSGAHFAVFPPALIEPCILAGCPPGGVVLDPFFGSGTVGQVAIETGRNWLGVEVNPEYIKLAEQRIAAAQPALIAPAGEPAVNIVQSEMF